MMEMYLRRLGIASCLGVAALALPRAALAEPRVHDDFFFRLSLGLGAGWGREELEIRSLGVSETNHLFGATATMEMLAGGTPLPGIVFGAAVGVLGRAKLEETGENADTGDNASAGIVQASLFTNWYPDPSQGLYLYASIGYASAPRTLGDVTYAVDSEGVALGAGGGYDFWMRDEWSLGPQFRVTIARLGTEEGSASISQWFVSPTLTIAMTYH